MEKLKALQSTTIKHSLPINILSPFHKHWVSNPERYYVTRKTDGVRMWLFIDKEIGTFLIDRYLNSYSTL